MHFIDGESYRYFHLYTNVYIVKYQNQYSNVMLYIIFVKDEKPTKYNNTYTTIFPNFKVRLHNNSTLTNKMEAFTIYFRLEKYMFQSITTKYVNQ